MGFLENNSNMLNILASILLIIILIKSIYNREFKTIVFWSGFLVLGYFYNKSQNQNITDVKHITFYAIDALQEWAMDIIEFGLEILQIS